MAWYNSAYIFISLIGIAHAYTTFNLKCSTPLQETNFVSSPDTRGTLDIIWSCLFTIFACTWTIQHLNVPEQRGNRDPGKWGNIKWSVKGVWNTTKWMMITILAPEIILGKALADHASAREDKKAIERFAKEDGVEWGMDHAFFANMGGVLVKCRPAVAAEPSEDVPLETSKLKERTSREEGREDTESSVVVVGSTLLHMRRERYISSLPDITSAELNDKSKGNIFIKAIAIGQVLWNAIQIIVRASRGLAITQLELATAAFSVCAIIIYLLLLNKPQGVQVPLRPVSLSTDYSVKSICKMNASLTSHCTGYLGDDVVDEHISFWAYMSNNLVPEYGDAAYFEVGSIVGAVLFGAIHTAGWNLSFHVHLESILWRVSSVYITASLPLAFGIMLIFVVFSTNYEPKGASRVIIHGWNSVTIFLYVIARLFLLVECFRTLFFLPPDAYTSTWASNIPHVA